MASPAMFPFLAVPKVKGASTKCMVGDLPDWYWTLELPEALSCYFCMDKLKVSDLENALRERHGWTAGFPPGTVGLGSVAP